MRAFRGSLKKKYVVQQSEFADKIKKLVRQHDEVFTAYVFPSWFLTKTLHTLIDSQVLFHIVRDSVFLFAWLSAARTYFKFL